MVTIAEIFGVDTEEALRIGEEVMKLTEKYRNSESSNSSMVEEVLKEEDERIREIKLFTIGVLIGGWNR